MGLANSFRGVVHHHHGRKHGSIQADIVLEELREYAASSEGSQEKTNSSALGGA